MSHARAALKPPRLWSRGFRPFFLVGALWAVAAILVWPAIFTGALSLPAAMSPIDWHVHEMIFGYGAAIVAGFLLTAIPNWTGRLPVAGGRLIGLVALWAVGRFAVVLSGVLGAWATLFLDGAFLFALAGACAREIVAGKNLRNLKVVVLVAAFAIANVVYHVEGSMTGAAPYASRAGVALLVLLILLIGGRVVPSFTHNWLAKHNVERRPVPFGKADAVVMGLSALALALWIALPEGQATGAALILAGVANLWRLARWCGWSARADMLVLVLHVGFFFASAGFICAAIRAFAPDVVPPAVPMHVWGIGAIGTMTVAMMTRATLGHMGRALVASRATQAVYALVWLALVARLGMALWPAEGVRLLWAAALCWIAAFSVFVYAYYVDTGR